MDIRPVTLAGPQVRLEPLALAHLPGLVRVGLDPRLWTWVPTPLATPADMQAYVELALDEQARGVALPFALVDPASGAVIGSTRYGAIERHHRRLEIGWTWVARTHQRTPVNTAAKRLLLGHAFETLGARRVELKTDALNSTSRNAILRIGATQEGIFRQHLVTASGRVRDTVYFSILDTEWPEAKRRLDARLEAAPAT